MPAQPIDKLLDLLKEPEVARALSGVRIELSGRASDEVLPALDRWMAGLDKQDPDFEHHLLEALWVNQHHNRVNVALLDRVLASPDFRARAAATRVLCYWRDRVSDALDRLEPLAADEHPRVRLEAVRAASFFTVPEAVEPVAIAVEQPTDEYLNFVRAETLKTLEPTWNKALESGAEIAMTTDAGRRYWLHALPTERLLKQPRTRVVCVEMLRAARRAGRRSSRRGAHVGRARQTSRSWPSSSARSKRSTRSRARSTRAWCSIWCGC